jgi:hypothetical protein
MEQSVAPRQCLDVGAKHRQTIGGPVSLGIPSRAQAGGRIAIDGQHVGVGSDLDRISADPAAEVPHPSAPPEALGLMMGHSLGRALFQADAIEPHFGGARKLAGSPASQFDQRQGAADDVRRELGTQSILQGQLGTLPSGDPIEKVRRGSHSPQQIGIEIHRKTGPASPSEERLEREFVLPKSEL